jgi:translation elongation factor P/translation initiation factor 5A
MIFAKGRGIKMSDEYRITQQVIERAFHQNNKIIFIAKIKAINLTTGKTFEFTSTALNEVEARKQVADQALNFTRNAD